jgi:hypothetical protein
MDGPAPGAGREEEGPVNVEEDELPLHALVVSPPVSTVQVRQRVTPRKVQITQMNVPQREQG